MQTRNKQWFGYVHFWLLSETLYKGVIPLDGWIMFSEDQSPPNHHTWETLDHLSPAQMFTRINSQWIFHLTEARTVSSIRRSQQLKFSLSLR